MKSDDSKNSGSSRAGDPGSVAQIAAEWVLRHDRGLTAVEQDEFSQWLAADPSHGAAWAEHRWGWDELDRLAGLQSSVHAAPEPDLLAPKKRGTLRLPVSGSVALLLLAVTVTISIVVSQQPWSQTPSPVSRPAPVLALIEQRELADGSTVELNRGAIVTERFTATERRVELVRGEAHFKVSKDAARPFVVAAAGVTVRALGTAFNVRLDSKALEVLVTEGTVNVVSSEAPPQTNTGEQTNESFTLGAGDLAVVALSSPARSTEVTTVPFSAIETRLAWRLRMLDFENTPLAEIVSEFSRHNPIRLTLGEPSLGGLRLSATFRSDNVEGFVRLMVSDFGMRAEWRGDGEVTLHEVSAPRKQ